MEDCQRRQEAAAVGAEEEGRGLRDRASSVFAVEVVKDEDVSLLSKRGESSLRVSVRKEEKVIRWERFLPRKFLRVLLVENDDSTRHIVATLLRKCSYQVAAVADGLKAWDVLKEKHYNFDLVLTEVETPSLSGIGLLSKIMSDEICKNIPVIMMSSNDSVGIVFKCMLKGAADFLVKPVRKNELRNLWQHVWRKYCSSSCGIGSGNRNLNLARLETMSDNVAAINHGKSIADNGSKTASSPDKDSDMESSCIRPEDGNGGLLKLREGSEREYRNFTLETYSTSKKRECDESHENGKTKDETMGIEIKMSLPIQAGASTRSVFEATGFYNGSPCREEDLVSARSKEGAICDFEHLNQIERNIKQSKEIFDFIGAASTEQSKFPISEDKDQAEDKSCKNSEIPDVKRNTNSVPTQLWELSLRGPQHKFKGHEVFQEKHVLNHSHASAFSRYGGEKLHVSCSRSVSSSASLCIRTSDSNGSNCHINPTIDKAKSIHFPLLGKLTPHRSEVEAITYYQLSSGSSKENAGPSASVSLKENAACVGHFSTVKPVIPHAQLEVIPHSIPVGALPFQNFCVGYGPIPHPIFCPKPFRPLCVSSENEKAAVFNPSAQDCNDLVNIHHINSSVGSEGHQLHMWKKVMEEQKSNTKTAYNSPMLRTSYEIADQVGNCNQDIADARRCNGSNDDVSVAVNMGTITESGTEEGFRNCKGDNLDRSCSQREAALSRFRLKRKDRCFEKKVRYHSRKKLAEQRPRLKGQFVRQAGAESAMITLESD